MFARTKKSGKYEYLQIVENRKVKGKVVQRVVATIGRMDHLKEKNRIETLIQSLARHSEKALLILSGRDDMSASARKIGPTLIFERLWEELGMKKVLGRRLSGRKYGFDVERAIFLTVLHRLFVSGSDRFCDKWRKDYVIQGIEDLSLHHFYRAMTFLGEPIEDQKDATPFAPRCVKDQVEDFAFVFMGNHYRIFLRTKDVYRTEKLFKQQTKSPNILLPILGLSRRNYNDKFSDYSLFLCNISMVINYSVKYKSALFNKLII